MENFNDRNLDSEKVEMCGVIHVEEVLYSSDQIIHKLLFCALRTRIEVHFTDHNGINVVNSGCEELFK